MRVRRWLVVSILPAVWLLAAPGRFCDAARAADGTAFAEPPSAPALKERVATLIDRLDANTLRERTQAERGLLELGPKILPLLPPPELLPDVSVREAVRRVRITLERRKAQESVLPARITLNEIAPLADVLGMLSERTGNAVSLEHVPEKLRQTSITVQAKDRPFWPTLETIATQAGLVLAEGARAETLELVPRSATASPPAAVTYAGPFRLTVDSARVRPLFGDDAHDLLRVRLGIRAEPRLRPLFLELNGKDVAALWETAKEKPEEMLPPFNPDAKLELPLGEGGRRLSVPLDFKVSAAADLDAVRLRGRVKMLTAADQERIVFRDLPHAAGVSRRRGGVTVRLEKVRFKAVGGRRKAERREDSGSRIQDSGNSRPSTRLTVRVAVTYDSGGPAFASHRTWIFHNDVYLLATAGRRIERNGRFETALQQDGAVAIEYEFEGLQGDPADYRFVYVAPTLLIDVPIEFEFPRVPVGRARNAGE